MTEPSAPRKSCYAHLVSLLAALGVALAMLPSGCASSSDSAPPSDCSVCRNQAFDCTAGDIDGSAVILAQNETGCSGSIGAGDEVAQLYIDCSTIEVCVEHEDECFPATLSAQGFSYTVTGKPTIACTAK